MPIAPASLAAHAAKGLRPLYVVHGDEPLLVQEACDVLRQAARQQGYADRVSFTVAGAHFDWSEVLAASGSQSLFADRQLIEIRIPSGKPGKQGGEALTRMAHAAQGQHDSTLTIIELPRPDKTLRAAPWFVALEAAGVVVPVESVGRSALPQWIARRLQSQNQQVPAGPEGEQVLQWVADRVEGNLLAAHQEIQKLALLYPAGPLKAADLEAAVMNVARYSPDALCEAIWTGQLHRAQRILDGLEAEGESEVAIHWRLADDIRVLYRARAAMAAGSPLPMALREARAWGPRERWFERVLPGLSAPALASLVQDARIVDGICKGLRTDGWPTQGWAALHRLAMQSCKLCRPR
jgi:DNA polymerase III subunit delta